MSKHLSAFYLEPLDDAIEDVFNSLERAVNSEQVNRRDIGPRLDLLESRLRNARRLIDSLSGPETSVSDLISGRDYSDLMFPVGKPVDRKLIIVYIPYSVRHKMSGFLTFLQRNISRKTELVTVDNFDTESVKATDFYGDSVKKVIIVDYPGAFGITRTMLPEHAISFFMNRFPGKTILVSFVPFEQPFEPAVRAELNLILYFKSRDNRYSVSSVQAGEPIFELTDLNREMKPINQDALSRLKYEINI